MSTLHIGRWLIPTVLLIAVSTFAVLLDFKAYGWALDFGVRSEAGLGAVYELARTLGKFPTWLIVAASVLSIDRKRGSDNAQWRAAFILLCGFAGALATAVLKRLIRRERPHEYLTEYVFRSFDNDFLSSSGLGMPSGDVTVACACLFALYRLYPGAWRIWLWLGLTCALCRMLAAAHFLSDVVVGILVGCACAEMVWRMLSVRLANGAGTARSASRFAVSVWLLAYASVIAAADLTMTWKPVQASDIPGLYFPVEHVPGLYFPLTRTDTKSYYHFRADGTYQGALLTEGEPAMFEQVSGKWSWSDIGLALDDGAPVDIKKLGTMRRLQIEGRNIYLSHDGG